MTDPTPAATYMTLRCCVCGEQIAEFDWAIDDDGQAWDVHQGECARQAEITEVVM